MQKKSTEHDIKNPTLKLVPFSRKLKIVFSVQLLRDVIIPVFSFCCLQLLLFSTACPQPYTFFSAYHPYYTFLVEPAFGLNSRFLGAKNKNRANDVAQKFHEKSIFNFLASRNEF